MHSIKIPELKDNNIKDDLQNGLSYLTDLIKKFSITQNGTIEYTLFDESSNEHVEKLIKELVKKVTPLFESEDVIMFNNDHCVPKNTQGVFNQLIEKST